MRSEVKSLAKNLLFLNFHASPKTPPPPMLLKLSRLDLLSLYLPHVHATNGVDAHRFPPRETAPPSLFLLFGFLALNGAKEKVLHPSSLSSSREGCGACLRERRE